MTLLSACLSTVGSTVGSTVLSTACSIARKSRFDEVNVIVVVTGLNPEGMILDPSFFSTAASADAIMTFLSIWASTSSSSCLSTSTITLFSASFRTHSCQKLLAVRGGTKFDTKFLTIAASAEATMFLSFWDFTCGSDWLRLHCSNNFILRFILESSHMKRFGCWGCKAWSCISLRSCFSWDNCISFFLSQK